MVRVSRIYNIDAYDPVEVSKKIDVVLLWTMIRDKRDERFELRTIYAIWRCYCNVFVHYPWYVQYLVTGER